MKLNLAVAYSESCDNTLYGWNEVYYEIKKKQKKNRKPKLKFYCFFNGELYRIKETNVNINRLYMHKVSKHTRVRFFSDMECDVDNFLHQYKYTNNLKISKYKCKNYVPNQRKPLYIMCDK